LQQHVRDRRTTPNQENALKSAVLKRSIVIGGHKTSVSLEDAFWTSLKDIASTRNQTLSELVAGIDTDRKHGNLSSGIRLFVLDHYRAAAEAGRGDGDKANGYLPEHSAPSMDAESTSRN
jgi:predicted DNA-binding ribbon-helix-helix protein